jgi:hypothetical protein
MKKILITASLFAAAAFAGPECTKEPKDKWQDQAKFQRGLKDQGYKISKFKVTEGHCYEIYGHNKEGKKVEIYYNPVDGKVVKEEIR